MKHLEDFYIPKKIDAPEKILLWTLDEVLSFIIPFFLGVALNQSTSGILIGVGSFIFWKMFKGSSSPAVLMGVLYWYLPSFIFNTRSVPGSHIRVILG